MRLRFKLLIVTLITILVLLSTILIVVYLNNRQKQILLESHTSQLKENFDTYINIKTKTLFQAANDYTFWDEMIGFVQSKDTKWANENLNTMLQTFNLNAFWVFDTLHTNVYYDKSRQDNDLQEIAFSKAFFDSLHKARFIHTFELYNGKPVEIVGATIHPTFDVGRKTVPRGYFIVAKIWDKQTLEEGQKVLSVKLSLASDNTASECPGRIIVFKPLWNWQDKLVTFIKVSKDYTFLQEYDNTSFRLLAFILISAVLVLTILIYVSSAWINKPLQLIEAILKNNLAGDVTKLNRFGKEFSQIGHVIDNFFTKNEELRIAKENAVRSDKLKTLFLSNMSHEIRTPMNGIIGCSELLINDSKTIEERSLYVHSIKSSCNDLLQRIEDILDASEIEVGQICVNRENFKLSVLFQSVEQGFVKKMDNRETKGIKFVCKATEGDVELFSDQHLIHKILSHLLDNALKFTKQGSIETGYSQTDSQIIFYVKDTGIGIPDDKLTIVFDNFRQADESITRSFGGNGLGLSVCKGLVELLGGKIRVESKIKKGSTFYFSIPLK